MHFVSVRAIVLVALAVQLGACHSFLGIQFARKGPEVTLRPETLAARGSAANTEAATLIGRRHLAEGQTGLAIESFRKALAAGEEIAPAVNGLGVAYARLGRFDLAQRYFQQAMASQPGEPKYAENFARLMRSPTLALRRDLDIARAAVQSAAAAESASKREAVQSGAVGKLQRISRGEVRIATAPAQAAPLAMGHAAIGSAAADGGDRPVARFAIAESAASRKQAPIRIVLPEPKPANAATMAAVATAKSAKAGR